MFLNITKCFTRFDKSFNSIELIEKKLITAASVDLNDEKQVDYIKRINILFMIGRYCDRFTLTTNYNNIYIHDKEKETIKIISNDLFNKLDDLIKFVINIHIYLNKKIMNFINIKGGTIMNKKVISITINNDIHEIIKKDSKKKNRSISNTIETILKNEYQSTTQPDLLKESNTRF